MGFSDLSSRQAVLDAIREFDSIGRNRFLVKYGFGQAQNYFLVYEGNQYDSKAIVGAAHGFQFGDPLGAGDFSGGKGTVLPKLRSLGFSVVAHKIDDASSTLPEEVSGDFWEGAKLSITVNKYERNAAARLACIAYHGTSCSVCRFDFGSAYGADFAGFIHVHHITPMAEIGKQYKIDPIKDLVPVCANCHAIIHYGGVARNIAEVREILQTHDLDDSH